MTWLLIAITAQIVLGTSAVFDKLLLKRGFADPWVYAFWFGLLGMFSFLLLPFGVAAIPLAIIPVALIAGAFFIAAMLCVFLAIQRAEVASVLALVGALSPIATLTIGYIVGRNALGAGSFIAFVFLIVGGLLFFVTEKRGVRAAVIGLSFGAGACFGISNILTKITFEQTSFLAGFFWPRVGGIMFALMFLLLPKIRRRIFVRSEAASIENKKWYFANRIYGSVGSFLVSGAIFLAHPALVDATQSARHAVIFLAGWLVLKEQSRGVRLLGKITATSLIGIGLILLGLITYAESIPVDANRPIAWGITFSDKYSRDKLGLDWQANFNAIIDELHPKKMRLIAYWDEIEKTRGAFDFSILDWQMARAREAGIQVVVVVGMKTPRWPECHLPSWAIALDDVSREVALHDYIRASINHYKSYPEVIAWQVENEPFLKFGLCGTRTAESLDAEIALVHDLDPSRPIITTDGGEFGLWYRAVRASDIFGTTMYRKIYSPMYGKYTGVIEYPLAPSFFRLKEKIVRWLADAPNKKFIVIELQAEPWGKVEVPLLPYDEQVRIFPPEYFRETIQYARETGFDEYYLWGAEWWYYVREKEGDSRYWDIVRNVLEEDKNKSGRY